MAGGVGSRFWPISRNNKPKQFLDFFGTGRSLLQMTFDRFRQLMPAENIFIVSNVIYKDLILQQLPEIKAHQVLLEPHRRNTAPCIAYAVYRIAAITDQANIVVAPSDHLILKENDFIDALKTGLAFVGENDSLLTLGIKPSRPETGYGYIQIDEGNGSLRKVKTFTEKPNLELAKVFFETGEFYWNAGIFLWSLTSIQKAFESYLPEVNNKFKPGIGLFNTEKEQQFIDEIYPSCPNISIDYGVMEKSSNVYVLCSDFGWTDLGTWSSLYELSDKDENGNAPLKCNTLFYNSRDNLVTMPEDKLVVVDGLEGYLIAESENVLLICKKDEEAKIRQMVNDANIAFEGNYN